MSYETLFQRYGSPSTDAENFIDRCTPQATRSRFYVKRFRRVAAVQCPPPPWPWW